MGSGKRNYKAMRIQYRKKPKKESKIIEIEDKKNMVDPEEYFKELKRKLEEDKKDENSA